MTWQNLNLLELNVNYTWTILSGNREIYSYSVDYNNFMSEFYINLLMICGVMMLLGYIIWIVYNFFKYVLNLK
jgi:hypothetical protein